MEFESEIVWTDEELEGTVTTATPDIQPSSPVLHTAAEEWKEETGGKPAFSENWDQGTTVLQI